MFEVQVAYHMGRRAACLTLHGVVGLALLLTSASATELSSSPGTRKCYYVQCVLPGSSAGNCSKCSAKQCSAVYSCLGVVNTSARNSRIAHTAQIAHLSHHQCMLSRARPLHGEGFSTGSSQCRPTAVPHAVSAVSAAITLQLFGSGTGSSVPGSQGLLFLKGCCSASE